MAQVLGLPERVKSTLLKELGSDNDYIQMKVYRDGLDEVFSDTYLKPEDAFAHFEGKEIKVSEVCECIDISGSWDITVTVGNGKPYVFSFFRAYHNTEELGDYLKEIGESAA